MWFFCCVTNWMQHFQLLIMIFVYFGLIQLLSDNPHEHFVPSLLNVERIIKDPIIHASHPSRSWFSCDIHTSHFVLELLIRTTFIIWTCVAFRR